jgi:hypothetical protein
MKNPETLATFVKQDTGQRQSRDTGNKWAHKTQDEDNPETLATNGHTRHRTDNPETMATNGQTRHRTKTIQRHWQQMGTQDTGRRQSRDTGNK